MTHEELKNEFCLALRNRFNHTTQPYEDIAGWALNDFIAEHIANKLRQYGVMQGCQCKDRIGETKVWCCNQCGLPCENGWIPTHYTVGSRTVGKAGEDASVRDGKVRGGFVTKTI